MPQNAIGRGLQAGGRWRVRRVDPTQRKEKPHPEGCGFPALPEGLAARAETRSPADQWNCSSSVEPVSAVTDEAPTQDGVLTFDDAAGADFPGLDLHMNRISP